MGRMKEGQIEIANWLNSERCYDDGVYLFNKYGRNAALKKVFPGRANRYSAKLAYELAKLIGIGVGEVAAEAKPEGVHLPLKVTAGALPPVLNYPPVVVRITAEMSRLYNERAMVKKQVNGVPDENTPEHVAKRLELNGRIESYSVRLDVLFAAKRAYLEAGVLPDESVLWPVPNVVATGEKPQADDAVELMKRRNSVRSSLTRARNVLEYGTQKKGSRPEPMPECAKRKELEAKIAECEAELGEIETKLGNVGECGSAPGTEAAE